MSRQAHIKRQSRRSGGFEERCEQFIKRNKALLCLPENGSVFTRVCVRNDMEPMITSEGFLFKEIPKEKVPTYEELKAFWDKGHKDEQDIAA